MKRIDGLLLALCALLSLGVAAAAARVADRYETGGAWRLELGRARLLALDPELKQRLAGLTDDLVFTYYVSPRSHMPSAMKRIERDVVDLLEGMRAAAPDKIDVLIVDPETDPGQQGYASNQRITPFRVRDVAHDAWSERLVWSALTMAYGARGEAVVNGITPERLPRLQATLAEHLERFDAPQRPRIALAAPPGFRELADALAEHGDVSEVDLDGGAPFPLEADILFWMRPSDVTPERLRELDRALALGRSAVVAGSLYRLPKDGLAPGPDGAPGARLTPSGDDLEALGSRFGLRLEPELPCDSFAETLVQGEQQIPVPFLVRCIAPNQSFVTWRNQPNGTLLFHAPTPLRLEPDVLRDLGYEARVHATTSDDTWLVPPPLDAARPLADCSVEHGAPTSKLPLMVSLQPNDPWRGRLVVLGAASPFEDGIYARQGTAHWRLARTLIDELGAPERLVAAATAEVGAPPPAPALSGGRRILWRALVVGLAPLLLLCAAAARGVLRSERRSAPGARAAARGARAWPRAVLAVAAAAVLARLAAFPSARADATADDLNSLAPETRAIAARAGQAGETRVELFFSPRGELPPSLRAPAGRVRHVLDDFARAGAELDVERVDVQDLEPAERDALQRDGVVPIQVATRDEEVTTVRTVYSALRLSRGERSEVLAFEDASAFELLEFRLAFALWRLETGREVKIAFAADAERMSAAEDFDFQQAGLFAPKGNDPYSLARGLLHRLDFDVANVTPRQFVATRTTQVPRDADLLVWLQPRRSIKAMMEETVRYLHGGGDVLIAAQHFKILSRQYRGRRFQMSYWPRPQSPDVDQVYLPEVGVRMPRDVLFDELCTEEHVDTEVVGRRGGRDYERQLSTRPFQVRVSAAGFADHPITRDLGDQAFPWASRIELDGPRLEELGLRSTVLMTTTERTWTFPWKGGFLEEGAPEVTQHLDGPPRGPAGEPLYLGRLPLGVLVEGQFPRPEKALDVVMGAEAGPADPAALDTYPEPRPGRLILYGNSSAFQDERLHDPEFRGDRLLLSSVAYLALEPELAAIATRHRAVRGFGYVETEEKLSWRSLVLAAPPAGILLLGAVVALARRRPPARRPA